MCQRELNQCKICSKSFAKKWNLVRHSVNIHGKIKSHQCSFCKLEFKCSIKLKSHITLMHRPLKFQSETCGQETEKKLKKHVEDQQFSCEQCDRSFSDENQLIVHIMVQHSKLLTKKCKICKVTCVNKYSLKQHMYKKHTLIGTYTRMSNEFSAFKKFS